MREVRIACLVEGDGEVIALPVLLRRIVSLIDPLTTPVIPPPFRHPSGSILRAGGIERAIEAVADRFPGHAIIVLIDCDDDCPKTLGPALAGRVRHARPDLHVRVALAHREYESWFLAAAESLRGVRDLDVNLAAPESPEEIRDAKGWLTSHIQGEGRYSPTQDQAALSARMDIALARTRSRSFR